MKPQNKKIEITIYSKFSINFKLNTKEIYMQENIQNQNTPAIQPQPSKNQIEVKKKNFIFQPEEYFWFIGGLVGGCILVLPFIFSSLLSITGYANNLSLSIIMCIGIIFSLSKRGQFVWWRALIAFLVVFSIITAAANKSVPPISSIIIGYLILLLSGKVIVTLSNKFFARR